VSRRLHPGRTLVVLRVPELFERRDPDVRKPGDLVATDVGDAHGVIVLLPALLAGSWKLQSGQCGTGSG
jgi:hypothetical protein